MPSYRHALARVARRAGARARVPVVLAVACLAGCAEESPNATVQSWRQSVERYVWDRGNGDPNVLADASWDDVHRGFAIISDALPDRSTDQIGLLVGHRKIEGRPYFIYLLASVSQEKLVGMRAVALNAQGDEFHWVTGPDEPDALAAYKAWSTADRKRAAKSDPAPPAFPRPGDAFDLLVAGSEVSVSHRQSGARWSLHVPPPANAAGAYSSDSSSPTSRPK